jgi:hypothetical protein
VFLPKGVVGLLDRRAGADVDTGDLAIGAGEPAE